MKVVLVFFCLLIICLTSVNAQEKVIIKGRVSDNASGEFLVGANVYIKSMQKGSVTDINGEFTIELLKTNDSATIRVSFIGYETSFKTIKLNRNKSIDFSLKIEQLEEVVVEADGLRQKLNSTQMSVEKLSMKDVKNLPVLFGEVDIIKTLQLKPGIAAGGEGQSGLFVRGGGPDQNLFLLDNQVLYNPNHLAGFFSVFNSDAIESVEIYKGGFPARYGGRLSSVVDVKSREGNTSKYGARGGIGLIASRITVEGPIQKNKSSFLISGRRTYFDVFTRAFNRTRRNDPEFNPVPSYYFYDLNGNATYKINDKNKLIFSGYLGRDDISLNQDIFAFDFTWGNSAAKIGWERQINDALIVTNEAYVSKYSYDIFGGIDQFEFNFGAGILDYTFASNWLSTAYKNHELRYGFQATIHDFELSRANLSVSDSVNFGLRNTIGGNEFGAYIADNWEVNNRLKIYGGGRLSGFQQSNNLFWGLEPRFSSRYKLSEDIAVKLSYARMYQYVHLIYNSGASLPTDVWYPSDDVVDPQVSDQLAGGYNILFSALGGEYLFSNEYYYKWFTNAVDFRDGADLFGNPNVNEEFVFGNGSAYGTEFYLEKKSGKTTGWIGYTLSWSWRQYDEINNGNRFHPRFDRRHDISVVVSHKINRRWNLSAVWVYQTGQAVTLPVQRLGFLGISGQRGQTPAPVPVYQDRNSFRYDNYHRLDLGAVYKMYPKWGEADLTFSVYNTYNRLNPFVIFFEPQYQNNNATVEEDRGFITGFKAIQFSLFPVIPTVTYNFKF